jgi:teichuronic acid biosynthesis glycosyltransferase TuaC
MVELTDAPPRINHKFYQEATALSQIMTDGISAPGRIRVLTFTTLYPSASQPSHGVFVENRLRHLVGTGQVEARVVAPVPWFPWRASIFGRYAIQAGTPREESRNGIQIDHPRFFLLPKLGMSITPATLFAATLPHVRRLLALFEFDLIDAHYFYPDGVAAVMLGRSVNKPVVITARGTDINLIPSYTIPRRQIQFAAKHAAGIVAVSQALKDAMLPLGIGDDKVTVLRNGVDLDVFKPASREIARKALSLNGRTLLSVGHLIERKGHEITIAALPRLENYTLLIAGEGPERSRLEALATRLAVADRVKFLGHIAHENLRQFYLAADALVLTSSREGWPNVLLEAMACGTPVVASAIWGNPEVVSSPEAGVLMQSRTPEGVAEAVESLFACLPSRNATRTFAERYSWDATSSGQIRLFERILADRSAS